MRCFKSFYQNLAGINELSFINSLEIRRCGAETRAGFDATNAQFSRRVVLNYLAYYNSFHVNSCQIFAWIESHALLFFENQIVLLGTSEDDETVHQNYFVRDSGTTFSPATTEINSFFNDKFNKLFSFAARLSASKGISFYSIFDSLLI